MLTELFVQKFIRTIQVGNLFSYPLVFDDKQEKLYVSSKHHVKAVIVYVLFCVMTLFIFRQTITYRKGDAGIFNFLQVSFYSMLAASIGMCIYSCQSEDLARCWNCLLVYGRNFYGKTTYVLFKYMYMSCI